MWFTGIYVDVWNIVVLLAGVSVFMVGICVVGWRVCCWQVYVL